MSRLLAPGTRTGGARAVVRATLVLLALLFGVRFALLGMVLGGDFVGAGVRVTPTMDSEARFLSALAVGYVVLAIWLLPRWEEYPRVLVLLAGITFLGGAMRLASWAVQGAPERRAMIALGLELALPALLLLCISRLEDAALRQPGDSRSG